MTSVKRLGCTLLLGLSLSVSVLFAKPIVVPYYPGLKGGLNLKNIQSCNSLRLTWCTKQWGSGLMRCMKIHMQSKPACQQNLLFFDASNGFFKTIQQFPQVAVVNAEVIAADHSSAYFMISQQGEVVSLLAVLPMKGLKGYKATKRLYPRMELFPTALSKPQTKTLANGTFRVVFQQSVLNGCLACSAVGQASVAYDFSKKGKFQGAKVIALQSGL